MVRLFQSCEGKQIGQHGRKRCRACRYLAETRRHGGYERARHGLVTGANCGRVGHDRGTWRKKIFVLKHRRSALFAGLFRAKRGTTPFCVFRTSPLRYNG